MGLRTPVASFPLLSLVPLAGACALLSAGVGCSDPQETLPPMVLLEGVASCAPEEPSEVPRTAPDICRWLGPSGSLVVGTVEGVDTTREPIADDCQTLGRALVVRLQVNELLWGDGVPDTMEVRYSPSATTQWSPPPTVNANGDISWRPATKAQTGPLVVGQEVGLQVVPAPGGEDFFVSTKAIGFLADGSVHLGTAPCTAHFEPPSRAALAADLASCDDPRDGLFAPNADAVCFDD